MTHFLVVVHAKQIPNYLALAVEKLAEIEGCIVSLRIDSRMKAISAQKWSALEHVINKRTPVFRKDPLGLTDLDTIVNSRENVLWINQVATIQVDWILLEDATICLEHFTENTKHGFFALEFNYKRIISETISNQSLTLSYLYKSPNAESWRLFSHKVGLEKGLKNNHDKVLWNFPVFLTRSIFQEFKSIDEINLQPFKKHLIVLKTAILNYQIRLLWKIIKRKLFSKQYNWKIAFEKDGDHIFLNQTPNSFWADPFFLQHNGIKALFIEELDLHGKGIISAIKLDEHFEVIEKRIIIEAEFSLSFPNVFIENGRVSMVPESSAGNKVLLYQCDDFPFKWSLNKVIAENMKLVDAVWVKKDDIYWLFANKIEDFEYDNNERLYLFSSKDFTSAQWHPHPLNPIVSGAECARNAGKIICEQGKLIRVAQNCKTSYGANLVFNEIEILSQTQYEEKQVATKRPKSPFLGQHTWNDACNGYSVSDYLIKE